MTVGNQKHRKQRLPWIAWLNIVAGVASVLSFAAIFIGGGWKTTFALFSLVLFLIAALTLMLLLFNRYARDKYPEGFAAVSTIVRYGTTDGKFYTYEAFKHIRCKQLVKASYDFEFKWSGTRDPTISSAFQTVGALTRAHEPTAYDRVRLHFRTLLLYNDVGVVQVTMVCDDSDRRADSRLVSKVPEPSQLIHWRVELLHAPDSFSDNAVVERRPIDGATAQEFQRLGVVSFNQLTKSYEHYISFPEPGYFYRLRWTRP